MKEYKTIYNTDEIDLELDENKLLQFLSEEDEEWRKFPDENFCDNYYISNHLRVYSVKSKKLIKTTGENRFYRKKGVNLSHEGEKQFFNLEYSKDNAFKPPLEDNKKAEVIDITNRLKRA
ncbi:hypothetical protein [Corticicoccus populi]|uniref:Uncharacterized protein n=1 Tax=Corticicoccus populi TaxID=1812821 RepID=A0ABW5WS18_9STAP